MALESRARTREAHTELVVGRDDATNAISKKLAEWAARNAKAEALLRAFETQRHRAGAVCRHVWRAVPRSTSQQLERARKLAAAAQGNPSASTPAV